MITTLVKKLITLSLFSNMGYKRDDPSTVHVDKMPLINEKGMAMHYGVCHENFVWQIRS
jgi:hypothetical protein